MPLFGQKQPAGRSKQLARANKALAKGRLKKAADLYEELLAGDPLDVEIHRRAAPVLARLKRADKAWESFLLVARTFVNAGFDDKAVGIYREAAHYLPAKPDVWLAIAEIHQRQDRPSDAVVALLDGRTHMRRRRQRPDALRLLRQAHGIEPLPLESSLDLARLLRRCGQRREAYAFLSQALRRTPRAHRRRIRAAQLRMVPTPAALYRWLVNPDLGRSRRR